MPAVELQNSAFACRIGDNSAEGEHRAGYNGVWSLVPRGQAESLFVPGIAGLNLEHYFDGWHNGSRDIFFEPRMAPMSLERLGAKSVRLHQPPTPFWGVESWTTFTVAEPNLLQMDYRGLPHRAVFNNGVMGVFWASYIQRPEADSIHFRERAGWTAFRSAQHGERSSVRGRGDLVSLLVSPGNEGKLYSSLATVEWAGRPAYYGRWRDRWIAFAFRSRELVRFAMSPSGGGAGNPAWDFQLLSPDYRPGGEVRLTVRCLVDRWPGVETAQAELARLTAWQGQPG